MKLPLFVLAMSLLMFACDSEQSQEHQNKDDAPIDINDVQNNSDTPANSFNLANEIPKTDAIEGNSMQTIKGQINYYELEGGFYGLVTPKGEKHSLLNLPQAFQQDGIMVEIEAQLQTDLMTTSQFGIPLKILEIRTIDTNGIKKPKKPTVSDL